MADELETPRHTQAELLPLLGLSAGSFQNWANRGLSGLSARNPGRGRVRLYSDLDAMRLLTMVELTRLGISASTAADFASKVIEPRARAKAEERRRLEETGKHTYGTRQVAIFYYEDRAMRYEVAETPDEWPRLARLRHSMKSRAEVTVYIETICEAVWEYFDERQSGAATSTPDGRDAGPRAEETGIGDGGSACRPDPRRHPRKDVDLVPHEGS